MYKRQRLSTATSASNVSGDFSGTYSISKATNFYGRLATGFRAPSIQGRLLFGDALSVANSEKVTSIEGGMKSDLLDGRARVSLGLFQYTMKNQQLTAVGGAANFNQLINADNSRLRRAMTDMERRYGDLEQRVKIAEIEASDWRAAAKGGRS